VKELNIDQQTINMVAASFHYSEQQVKPEKANKQTNKHIQNL
jgi:hypothetical protein